MLAGVLLLSIDFSVWEHNSIIILLFNRTRFSIMMRDNKVRLQTKMQCFFVNTDANTTIVFYLPNRSVRFISPGRAVVVFWGKPILPAIGVG